MARGTPSPTRLQRVLTHPLTLQLTIQRLTIQRLTKQRLGRQLLLLSGLCSGTLHAQDTLPEGLNVQRYAPLPGGTYNFNQVVGAGVTGSLQPTFGLQLHYAYRSLVARPSPEIRYELLKHDLEAEVLVGLGLGKRFQLGVATPVVLYQAPGAAQEGFTPPTLKATLLGDVRIVPKIQLLGKGAEGLALLLPISINTGSPLDFHGEAGPTVHPMAAFQLRPLEPLSLAFNVGYYVRPTQKLYDLTTGNELSLGVAGAFALTPKRLEALAEVYGRAPAGPGVEFKLETFPFESNLGLRMLNKAHSLTFSVGLPLTRGYGVPTVRGLLAYAYTPVRSNRPSDQDRDGIIDSGDLCPTQAEDVDGFQDGDGCPDADNDGDGFKDASDGCPMEPEDRDGFQDVDGCPEEEDNDRDKDRVPDTRDRCPDEAEDLDGFQDGDGCPELDNDGDTIPDKQDQCPTQPEDMDKLADEDGCPETDADSDGIPDEKDLCPRKAETVNGIKDDDGCPEEQKGKKK